MAKTPKPGYYDDGMGAARGRRWWNGVAWTDQYEADALTAAPSAHETAAVTPVDLATATPADVIWQSVGRPLTGLGAGRFKLTPITLTFEKGTLSLNSQQIATHEIHDVDVMQTITQKARSVGTITLTAVRAGGRERVVLDDVPDFREGAAKINEVAHWARDAHLRKQQTQTVNYTGGAPHLGAPAAVPASNGLNDELARLAGFREQGILTDEEFTAAKRKLLGL